MKRGIYKTVHGSSALVKSEEATTAWDLDHGKKIPITQIVEAEFIRDAAKPKWVLKWSGSADMPRLRAAFKHCSVYTLWKDAECQICDATMYKDYVASCLLENCDYIESWAVQEGEIGMICLAGYADRYQDTWNSLSSCKNDFEAGYTACEDGYQHLRAWDEALKLEKDRKTWLKISVHTVIFETHDDYDYDTSNQLQLQYSAIIGVTFRSKRNETTKAVFSIKCTGEELAGYVFEIRNWRRWDRKKDWTVISCPTKPVCGK